MRNKCFRTSPPTHPPLLSLFVLSLMLRYSCLSYGAPVTRKALILVVFVVPSDLVCFLVPRCPHIFVNALLPVLYGLWRNLSLGLLAYHFLLAYVATLAGVSRKPHRISPRRGRLFQLALTVTGASHFILAFTEGFLFHDLICSLARNIHLIIAPFTTKSLPETRLIGFQKHGHI